jgi:hypothetical protein
VQAQAAPSAVGNWEYVNGALLAVCFQYGHTYSIEGTAVMIGMGRALSAKHVFDEHRDALAAGDAVLLCLGLRPNGVLDIWHCYRMMTCDLGTGRWRRPRHPSGWRGLAINRGRATPAISRTDHRRS